MQKIVLITGGTGTLGTTISRTLSKSGFLVRHLSRTPDPNAEFPSYYWNVKKGEVDDLAFSSIHSIIHLAGAGVADQRWSNSRKKEILSSRVDSSKLLLETVHRLGIQLESFISASAIGIYGDSGANLVIEESPKGSDFLAEVVKDWEASVDGFSSITRLVKIRIGVVLSKSGGALAKMAQPVKLGAGAPLGSGNQYISWIHEEDLAEIFKFSLNENITGAYNAVAPEPATNKEFTKRLSKTLARPLILPNVPGFILKLALGEMASIVLTGSRVSCEHVLGTGFQFKYPKLEDALKNLLL